MSRASSTLEEHWLALAIGNSRLHWGWFVGAVLQKSWDSPHLDQAAIAPFITDSSTGGWKRLFLEVSPVFEPLLDKLSDSSPALPLWMVSVVPDQTALWLIYPQAQVITLEQVPLSNLYPSLGIDRAVALWGAVNRWGTPTLVIDAGTALTLTRANRRQEFAGGAILPGLQLQRRSLADQTAALPLVGPDSRLKLPERWASNTPDAIHSGTFYTVLASLKDFITAWQQEEAQGAIALTGGDCHLLFQALTQIEPTLAAAVHVDPDLIFRGLSWLRWGCFETLLS